MITESPRLVAIQREKGLRGKLHEFVRMAWPILEAGQEFVDNWHIGAICEHLEAVTSGDLSKLLVNVPPGMAKSSLVSVYWPTWWRLRQPDLRTLGACYDEALALRDSRKEHELITSEWFKARWGDRVSVKKEAAKGDYVTDQGGQRFATSIPKGSLTGRHFDVHIIDDPNKPAETGKIALEAVRTWNDTTRSTRWRNLKDAKTVCIMQRLDEGDLAGHLIEQGFEVLRLPMRFEEKARCSTSIGFTDPRTKDGELLFPARFPEEAVQQLEKDLGPLGVAAQLQQRPSPAGGLIFQNDWFRHICQPDCIEPHAHHFLPKHFESIIQSWDCTFKETSDSDYVVGQVWGRSGPNFYLLDMVRRRMDFPSTLEAVKAMSKKWPRATVKLIEDKANGPAIIAVLKKELRGIIEVEPLGGKVARANAVAPLYQAANVWHPSPNKLPGVTDFERELVGFPKALHDDTVDAMSQGLSYLHQTHTRLLAAMKAIKPGEM